MKEIICSIPTIKYILLTNKTLSPTMGSHKYKFALVSTRFHDFVVLYRSYVLFDKFRRWDRNYTFQWDRINCAFQMLKPLTAPVFPVSLWLCYWDRHRFWASLLDSVVLVLSPEQKVEMTNPESLCGFLENFVHVTAVAARALERWKSATGHLLKRQHTTYKRQKKARPEL